MSYKGSVGRRLPVQSWAIQRTDSLENCYRVLYMDQLTSACSLCRGTRHTLCAIVPVLLSRDMGESNLSSILYNLFMNVPLSRLKYHKAPQIEERTGCYHFEELMFSFFIYQNYTFYMQLLYSDWPVPVT